jgi:hypothetical protein
MREIGDVGRLTDHEDWLGPTGGKYAVRERTGQVVDALNTTLAKATFRGCEALEWDQDCEVLHRGHPRR